MNRLRRFVVLVALVLSVSALAGSIPIDALPMPNRLAGAEAVVVGKVTGMEEKTVTLLPFAGAPNKLEYHVAVVTIADPLLAPQGAKTIRLAFQPLPPGVAVSPPPFQPTMGLEGCLFLTKLPDADVYTVAGALPFVPKQSPTFEKDVALLKRCIKLMENPNDSLKAKEAEDRFLTAAMLLAKYRSRRTQNDKSEPIDAEQSKLILQALAGADWTPPTDYTQLSPQMVLFRLPLTEKEGWTPPKEPKALGTYAQQWLKEHAGTYRIERFVPAK
jgi:hypothetical protein